MKLWSGTLSPFSAKVRMVLAEKGIDVAVGDIPWTRAGLWGPKPSEFLAVSPRGEVPVLEIGDGAAVVDSTIINEYLEDAFPAVPLMPADPGGRALCRMIEDEADRVLAEQVTVLIREVFIGGGAPDATGDGAAAVAAIRAFHDGLDRRLTARGDWLCGAAFTVADIAAFLACGFAATLGVPPTQAAVTAWFDRVMARPAIGADYGAMMGAAAAA